MGQINKRNMKLKVRVIQKDKRFFVQIELIFFLYVLRKTTEISFFMF